MRPRRGLTLIELLLTLVMTTAVIGTVLFLVLTQTRYATRITDSVAQVNEIATAQQLLRDEIADLPRGAVTFAGRDSVAYRFPVRWGVVCGPVDRHILPPPPAKKTKTVATPVYSSVTALQLSPVPADIGSPDPEGLALSVDGVTFTYYPISSWAAAGINADTAAASACLSGVAPPRGSKKKPGKKDALPPPVSVVVVNDDNFFSSTALTSIAGGTQPEEQTLLMAYINVSYHFRADSAGTRALFRSTRAGTQRLAAPFATSAGFAYRLSDGSTAATGTSSPALVRAIRVDLPTLRRATATTGSVDVFPWLTMYNAR